MAGRREPITADDDPAGNVRFERWWRDVEEPSGKSLEPLLYIAFRILKDWFRDAYLTGRKEGKAGR